MGKQLEDVNKQLKSKQNQLNNKSHQIKKLKNENEQLKKQLSESQQVTHNHHQQNPVITSQPSLIHLNQHYPQLPNAMATQPPPLVPLKKTNDDILTIHKQNFSQPSLIPLKKQFRRMSTGKTQPTQNIKNP